VGPREPGIVLDELNAALRPHGLRFASTSRRQPGDDRRLMANNSSGARSVLYGKTMRSRGGRRGAVGRVRVVHLRDRTGRRSTPDLRGRHARRCLSSRSAAAWPTRMLENRAALSAVLRRVGGYNSDAFVDGDAAVQTGPGEADGRLKREPMGIRHRGERLRAGEELP
jgi:hypothetical protein